MSDGQPVGNQISPQLVQLILAEHDSQQTDAMGQLHNRFIAYIAESRVSLPNIITVLELLLDEAITLARQRYVKGEPE
jgi:hypothetical protein